MKRFWKNVAIVAEGDGWGVALDGRPVRTPARVPLAAPTRALGDAIAEEWRGAAETVDPRAMPLTGLLNAAIDRIAPDAQAFAAGLAAYGENDLLYYRAQEPPPLVDRQRAAWDPMLAWARGRYDVHFETIVGVMPRAQPERTIARLADAIAARTAYQLACLSPIVTVTGSLVLALALIEGAADAATVWRAARIDDDWQEEQWGADPLAVEAAEARRADFDSGVRFLALVGGAGS
jgi:chaperone required for assembly of F1-ATPase